MNVLNLKLDRTVIHKSNLTSCWQDPIQTASDVIWFDMVIIGRN